MDRLFSLKRQTLNLWVAIVHVRVIVQDVLLHVKEAVRVLVPPCVLEHVSILVREPVREPVLVIAAIRVNLLPTIKPTLRGVSFCRGRLLIIQL